MLAHISVDDYVNALGCTDHWFKPSSQSTPRLEPKASSRARGPWSGRETTRRHTSPGLARCRGKAHATSWGGQLAIVAAGAAFFALIATFPALLVLLEVYGLVFDPAQVAEQVQFLGTQLEPEAISLVAYLLRGLGGSDRSGMGFGIVGGALTTLWGASLGVRALMRALNVAYREREKRSLLTRYGLSVLLTTGAMFSGFLHGLGAAERAPRDPMAGAEPDAAARRIPCALADRCHSLLAFAAGVLPLRPESRVCALVLGQLGRAACDRNVARRHRGSRLVRCRLPPLSPSLWLGRSGGPGAGLVSDVRVLRVARRRAERRLERQTREDTAVGDEKLLGSGDASVAETLGDTSS